MENTMTVKNFTKKQLEELKQKKSSLMQDVIDWVLEQWDYYNNKEDILLEVIEHGCKSGIVSSLIYYEDTVSFYYKHKENIKATLYKEMNRYGTYKIQDIIIDWNEKDPLALETYNQNLLSWYAFEKMICELHNYFF